MFLCSLLSRPCLLLHLLGACTTIYHAVAVGDPSGQPEQEPPTRNIPSLNSNRTIWPADAPAPITVAASDLTLPNPSNLTGPLPECNGRLYGRNLRRTSCMQVYHAMASERFPVSFGERGTGVYDGPLPFRYLSHDGLCAIDLAHVSGIMSDVIAPIDLKVAARLLISICVSQTPNEGGILTGLGQNKALAMRIMPYRPTVKCGPDGSGPPWVSCRDIVDVMPANDKAQVFGPKEDKRTTVPLPWKYTTTRQRCGVIVDGTEPGRTIDTGNWYKIWAAANAVEFMCTQLGKDGNATSLGELHHLYMTRPSNDYCDLG